MNIDQLWRDRCVNSQPALLFRLHPVLRATSVRSLTDILFGRLASQRFAASVNVQWWVQQLYSQLCRTIRNGRHSSLNLAVHVHMHACATQIGVLQNLGTNTTQHCGHASAHGRHPCHFGPTFSMPMAHSYLSYYEMAVPVKCWTFIASCSRHAGMRSVPAQEYRNVTSGGITQDYTPMWRRKCSGEHTSSSPIALSPDMHWCSSYWVYHQHKQSMPSLSLSCQTDMAWSYISIP